MPAPHTILRSLIRTRLPRAILLKNAGLAVQPDVAMGFLGCIFVIFQ